MLKAKAKKTDSMSIFAAMLMGAVLTLGIGFFMYLWNPFNQGKTKVTSTEEIPMIEQKTPAEAQPEYEFYDLLKGDTVNTLPTQSMVEETPVVIPETITPDVVVTNNNKTTANTETNSNPEAVADNATNTAVNQPDEMTNKINELSESAQADVDSGKASINENPTNVTYILQINSFDNADDADKRRAQVLMAGVEAQVVKKQTQDGSSTYQVISRPMTNQQMVAEAQLRLQNNGIDSLIVEQRHQ